MGEPLENLQNLSVSHPMISFQLLHFLQYRDPTVVLKINPN